MFTRATQCVRGVLDPPVSAFSLYRHSYIGFILAFASSIHNKQYIPGDVEIFPKTLSSEIGPPHTGTVKASQFSCGNTGLCHPGKTTRLDCLLPPPRTLILDFTLTPTRFGKSQLSSMGQLTHTRRTDNTPEPDGGLKTVTRAKNST
jgi:hypothetical protein